MCKSLRTLTLLFIGLIICTSLHAQVAVNVFPANGAEKVNPDTRLILTFSGSFKIRNKGQIKIYDYATDELVDMLDMSIPPGPKNTRTPAPYESLVYNSYGDQMYSVKEPDTNQNHVYQKNYIGGTLEVDAFHFYPVIVRGQSAIICPHNNKLKYNKTYYVQIDPEVFSNSNVAFQGFKGKKAWVFGTKKQVPSLAAKSYVVSANGTGDFSTVQGAVDYIPEKNADRKTIHIRNGIYDEIVYFRNKENITFAGEDREKVIINYANNGVFNTRLMSADPALSNGSHSLRAVFAIHNSRGIQLRDLTLRSLGEKPAQAEALLVIGKKNIISGVNIEGSGDALQATGTIYVRDSKIQGFGDNVLGYGAVFFENCDFVSTYGPHLWVRNTQANHGNVLLNCTLRTIGDVETTIARAPNSNGFSYPFVEAVLIDCKLDGIVPEGWGKVADETKDIRYWEYNSTTLDGKPIDSSRRHAASRQLDPEKDKELLKNYRTPSYILEGWTPVIE
ncbi:MAG: pectinesterase family protein [Arcticibacter sp.]